MITLPKILAELDLAIARTEFRLAVVVEQMGREAVVSSQARRLRSERDQLHEEIYQRRNLRAMALRGVPR